MMSDDKPMWKVNVTSAQGDERIIPVAAYTRSEAFRLARIAYRMATGREGIQLSARQT